MLDIWAKLGVDEENESEWQRLLGFLDRFSFLKKTEKASDMNSPYQKKLNSTYFRTSNHSFAYAIGWR
jgi:hypothetical protein